MEAVYAVVGGGGGGGVAGDGEDAVFALGVEDGRVGLDVAAGGAGPVGGGGVEAAVEVGVGGQGEVVGRVGAGGYEDGCFGVGVGCGQGGGEGGVGGGGRAGGGGVVAGWGDVEDLRVGVEVDGCGLGADRRERRGGCKGQGQEERSRHRPLAGAVCWPPSAAAGQKTRAPTRAPGDTALLVV